MKLRLRIALILLLAMVLGGVFWRARSRREPVYRGRPLSYWLVAFELDYHPVKPNRDEAVEAVRDADTNAVPMLLRMLRVKDSDLKQRLARLGQKQRFIKVQYVSADVQNWAAWQGFMALNRGPAQFAIPSLVEIYSEDISRGETNSLRHGYVIELLELLKARGKPVK